MRTPLHLDSPILFWVVVCSLLAVMGGLLYNSSLHENSVWDEPAHLAGGYVYAKTGNFWWDQYHAPLPRLLIGSSLLAGNPRLPTEHPSWRQYNILDFSHHFLYRNRLSADRLLLLGRLPIMAATLVLGLAIALWTRKHFGPLAALFALTLYALDPNIIANGRYATTDLVATLFIFLACITWARYLTTKNWYDLLAAGVVLGLALSAKYSALLLCGLFPLLYLVRWWQKPKEFSLWRLAVSLVVVMGLGVTVLAATYWPVSRQVWDGPIPLAGEVDPSTRVGKRFQAAGEILHLPFHPYLMGLYYLSKTYEKEPPWYLLGERSTEGWWYFYPVVMAVKLPTAVLLGLVLAIVAVALLLRKRSIREVPYPWMVVMIVPAAYFLVSMSSHINNGMRHVLPVYPFLLVFVAAVLARRLPWMVMILLAGFLVFENARIYPHYLAFYNSLAGGAENGDRYLVDCNLDWGQDAKKLKAYMDEEGLNEVCLSYFGRADLDYYGVRHRPLPRTWEEEGIRDLDCIGAISATNLHDVYLEPGSYQWLRERQPIDKVGYSIYLYDLRKK